MLFLSILAEMGRYVVNEANNSKAAYLILP